MLYYDVWELNHVRHLWEVIIQNHFDYRLRHFRRTKTIFQIIEMDEKCLLVGQNKIWIAETT